MRESRIKPFKHILALIILSFFFFFLGNGILSLTNPDEVFYVQTAREMAQHHTWMTPYLFGQPQFEKPVLTYWFLRFSFPIFGVSDFGVRFFPAVFAILGVISTYLLGWYGFKDEKKAFLSSLILMSGVLYVGLARTVYTDMFFSVFIFLSLVSFYWGYALEKRKRAGILLFFVFSGLAVLTKGPLGILIPLLTVIAFLLIRKDMKFLFCNYSAWGLVIFSAIAIPWYVLMIAKYGHSFIYEFFYNDHIRRILEAEHTSNDTWYFYPLTIVLCTFPWGLLVAASLVALPVKLLKQKNPLHIFLACWIGMVFLIFQPAHSKLVSYILPLFPALTLVAGDFIYETLSGVRWSRVLWLILFLSSLILLLIPIGLIVGWNKYSGYISSKIPVYITVAAFTILAVLMLYFIFKNKLQRSVYLLALVTPIFLGISPFIANDLEPYLSSNRACQYLAAGKNSDGTILCSKFFARGVNYYTGRNVAAIAVNGTPFFSPHPIPFLDSEQKVRGFLRSQPVTYCVVRKSQAEEIECSAGDEFKSTILRIAGDEYVLKIEPAASYLNNSRIAR